MTGQTHQVFNEEVVLITGATSCMGASLARQFHAAGARVIIHYHDSQNAARALASELEDQRARSVHLVRQSLGDQRSAQHLITHSIRAWGRLDILVNNASIFLPTPLESLVEADVTDLLTSNFLAPLYTSQAAVPYLRQHEGCIANLIDIHADQVLADHSIYCSTNAALSMLTKSLALELAPSVRVNAVAPGTLVWPEGAAEIDATLEAGMLASIPVAERGSPAAVAAAVVYLCSPLCSTGAGQVTGQILAVDGGRSQA